jgi:hypothetical protein
MAMTHRQKAAAMAAALVLASAEATVAQSIGQGPLHSFSIVSDYLGCTGMDFYINLALYPIGSGSFPPDGKTSTIVGVDLQGFGFGAHEYVVLGKTPPYGDTISPFVYGDTNRGAYWFPAGTGYPFNPSTGQLHLHYNCSGKEVAWFALTVTYTTP